MLSRVTLLVAALVALWVPASAQALIIPPPVLPTIASYELEVGGGGRYPFRITGTGIDCSSNSTPCTTSVLATCDGADCTPRASRTLTATSVWYPGMTFTWSSCDDSAGDCATSQIAACAGASSCIVELESDLRVSVSMHDRQPPTVSVADQVVGANTPIAASARDNAHLDNLTLHLNGSSRSTSASAGSGSLSFNIPVDQFGTPPAHGTTLPLRAVARDRDGNQHEEQATVTFDLRDDLVVTEPPTYSPVLRVSFTPEAGATTTCGVRVAGSEEAWSMSPCASPYAPGVAMDGAYEVRIASRDRVWNPAERTVTTILDRAAPILLVDSSVFAGSTTDQRSAWFDVRASDPYLVATECSFDGAPFASCSGEQSHDDLAAGSHVFVARSSDRAGNVATRTIRWTIDATPPVVTLDGTPAAGSTVTDTSAQLTVTSDGRDLMCALDGMGVLCNVGLANLAPGTHTYVAIATDVFGRSSTASRTWTITAPTPAPAPTPGSGPAPAPTAAAPAAAAPDTVRPTLGVLAAASQRLATVRRTGVRVRVSPSEQVSMQVTMKITALDARRIGLRARGRAPVVIGTARASSSSTRFVSVRLTKAASARLARLRGRIRTTVVVTAVDAAGNRSPSVVRTVWLR